MTPHAIPSVFPAEVDEAIIRGLATCLRMMRDRLGDEEFVAIFGDPGLSTYTPGAGYGVSTGVPVNSSRGAKAREARDVQGGVVVSLPQVAGRARGRRPRPAVLSQSTEGDR